MDNTVGGWREKSSACDVNPTFLPRTRKIDVVVSRQFFPLSFHISISETDLGDAGGGLGRVEDQSENNSRSGK